MCVGRHEMMKALSKICFYWESNLTVKIQMRRRAKASVSSSTSIRCAAVATAKGTQFTVATSHKLLLPIDASVAVYHSRFVLEHFVSGRWRVANECREFLSSRDCLFAYHACSWEAVYNSMRSRWPSSHDCRHRCENESRKCNRRNLIKLVLHSMIALNCKSKNFNYLSLLAAKNLS